MACGTRFTRSVWMSLCAAVLVPALFAACAADPNARKQEHFLRATRYFEAAQYRQAIIEYRNAVQIDPMFGMARLKLAESYARLGDAAAARGEYVRAADLLRDRADVQLTAGRYLLAAGQLTDAIARADAALSLEPASVDAHVLRASALAGLRDFENALADVEEALRLDPRRGATYVQLGSLQQARGQNEEAEAAFNKALALAPRAAGPQLSLAHYYWAAGRTGEAEQAIRAALEREPSHAVANRAMAALLLATDRAAEAEPYLLRLAQRPGDVAASIALADYYVALGRPEAAISRLEALAQNPAHADTAGRHLAAAHARAGNRAKALEVTDNLLKRNARDAAAHLTKSQLLLAEGRRDDALAHAQAAADAEPASAEAQLALGRLYAARGDAVTAQRAFKKVLELNPAANIARAELARLQLSTGQSAASLRTANEALAQEPRSVQARLAVARAALATKDVARADRELAALLREHPGLASVHALKGLVAAERKDSAGARRALEHALSLDANSAEGLAGLLALDLVEGNLAGAKARIDRRLAAGTPSPELLLVAARTYAGAGDPAAAERFLRQAIDADPTLLPAYSMLGQLYLKQKRLDEARREFEALAARHSRPVPALTMAGMILYVQGNVPEARRRFQEALAIEPTAPIAANNLAWSYAEAGENLDVALQLALTATTSAPDVPEMIDTLGWIYYKKKQPELALAAFSRSIEKDPRNPSYQYHSGLAYLQAGDVERGRAALERALKLRPDFPGADDARRKLATLNTPAGR